MLRIVAAISLCLRSTGHCIDPAPWFPLHTAHFRLSSGSFVHLSVVWSLAQFAHAAGFLHFLAMCPYLWQLKHLVTLPSDR